MKTLAITLTGLFFSMLLSAQITLENTYTYSGTLTAIDSNEYKYFVMDVPMKQCRLYNEDHSLFKTISLSVPEGYFLYDIKFVSRKVFNTDDKIELLYVYTKLNASSVTVYGLKIVNEDGTVLLTLQNGGFAEIKEFNGAPKLLAYQYIWNSSYYLVNTLLYGISGDDPNNTSLPLLKSLKIYPNPAKELVYVDMDPESLKPGGNILVSDMAGRTVLQQSYTSGTAQVEIYTGTLDPGTYMISVLSEDGHSSAGKIAIN